MNTTDDVFLHSGSLLSDVLFLPPPTTMSCDDAAPCTLTSKVHNFTYYDQIWVYSELEAFKHGISKENFAFISNLQRLDRINALEKPEPIQLSFRNQILTYDDENSIDSDDSNSAVLDSNNHHAPKGDKVTI